MTAKYHILIGGRATSSWSLRGWLPLAILRLNGFIDDFDETMIDWQNPHRQAEIIAKGGGSRTVPILYHGKKAIWESLVICEYLAAQYPEASLWVQDDKKEHEKLWHGRILAGEMHSGFQALRRDCPMKMLDAPHQIPLNDATRNDIARINQLWGDCFEKFSGKFLLGNYFSVCDIMFAPVVSRFVTYQIETPHQTYLQQVMIHPAITLWLDLAKKEHKSIAENTDSRYKDS